MRPFLASLLLAVTLPTAAEPVSGYYRQPALRGDTLVFVSEGDLWRASVARSGPMRATRLTSHPGAESLPAISQDGARVAFSAEYEGPQEVYVMPIDGGTPQRLTFDGGRNWVVGWTPDDRVIFATENLSGFPQRQLVLVNPETSQKTVVSLAQAADGAWDASGRKLFFTRLPFQGSFTKRYQGGSVQSIWRFDDGAAEAVPLTSDWTGTSRDPSWSGGRVYFASDRDGTMNLWSIDEDGKTPKQHTYSKGWDVASPSVDRGRAVYQQGADLHLLDLATGADVVLPLSLDSDFDQLREKWIGKPMEYLTSAHVAPDGGRVALTARGQVFVAPVGQGRFVEVARRPGVRYRDARFMPDGKSLLALSDESGEVEAWTLPADGVGIAKQLSKGGDVLRWEALPSPDGKWIAHHDKNQRLWLLEVATGKQSLADENAIDSFADLTWSPDSRWLAYVAPAENLYRRILLVGVGATPSKPVAVTSDRFDSYSPEWSPDGKWLYFLSDRHLESIVGSPWGAMQPEPFFDRSGEIYQLALVAGERSPFAPKDELHPDDDEESDEEKDGDAKDDGGKSSSSTRDRPKAKSPSKKDDEAAVEPVAIDFAGIESRLVKVPVPAGNYASLSVTGDRLFVVDADTSLEGKRHLKVAKIARKDVELKTLVSEVESYEPSADGKKLLVRKEAGLFVIDASADAPADLEKAGVDLSAWKLSVQPREEWRQMFTEAWRLERDYFYDTDMHCVGWKDVLPKYQPLVERVSDRAELSDLVSQMVSELCALHTFVYGGDRRKGTDDVKPGSLGAELVDDAGAGGWRVVHVHRSDPDRPDIRSPLSEPGVDVVDGDVILSIDGVATSSVADPSLLLRNKAGRQVLLRVRSKGKERDAIVVPLDGEAAMNLRYHEWEHANRLAVEKATDGDVGYVHLRAMGRRDFADWARGYYPAFTRQGLVVDVRGNGGGNIDSWILGRLLRKAWFFWSQRVGASPTWNMQQAFRGHLVVLCDEGTGSDGEAFTEGFRRLGLGTIIGTRTWGGEIWLTSSNVLVDKGIATAAEFGVYGPEGKWLIEGHGVEPDVVVDNLPHATYEGKDAQLDAAIAHLKREIALHPVETPPVPKHPDKSLRSR